MTYPEPTAVLFDMDGTLLDSEDLWDRALAALAEHRGGVLSHSARLAMVGRGWTESMEIFYQDLGIPKADPAADHTFLSNRMAELFATELTWRPGAANLLAEIRAAKIPTALVTSTARRLTELALDTLGRDNFDAVVCGDEVRHPKPHPEPYRTAAQLVGASITTCIAVEDSPTGMASALAAGAVVVGVPGHLALTPTAGVHLVDSLATVTVPYLAGLLNSTPPTPAATLAAVPAAPRLDG